MLRTGLLSELLAAFVAMVALLMLIGALTWWLVPSALLGVIVGWCIGLPLGLALLVFLGPRHRPP
ncbi:MAG: hypothetical protein HY677_06060 [Chloroflexi bacterium]|nr:hypothetical protein [Chloroflexota bacterium]